MNEPENYLFRKVKDLESFIPSQSSMRKGGEHIFPSGGGMDYDFVYVGGKRLTPPTRTTNFLKVYLDGTTTPEWVEAMPNQQDANAEVFDVSKTRIHIPGNFAG